MPETIVIFRLSEAPARLTKRLPKKAGPWRCLCWIAQKDSKATKQLFQAIAEPDIDHVDEALDVVADIAKDLRKKDLIPAAVGPGSVFDMGFHSGDADEVETFFRKAGHILVPIFDFDAGEEVPSGEPEEEVDPARELYFAAVRGDREAFDAALERGAEPGFKDATTGATALHEAASRGNLHMVARLLEKGADVNAAQKGSRTPPLGCAIDGGHLDVVKRLLDAGARTDVVYDRVRHMPIHAAAGLGAAEIVEQLVESGADATTRTTGGKSALDLAVQGGHDPATEAAFGAVIVALRRAGADAETNDAGGESALDLARSLGRDHLLPYLAEAI